MSKLSEKLKSKGWITENIDGINYTYNKDFLQNLLKEEKTEHSKTTSSFIVIDLKDENNPGDEIK